MVDREPLIRWGHGVNKIKAHIENISEFIEMLHCESSGAFLWFNDPRLLRSRCIKGTVESLPKVDLSVPLMHHDPSDLGLLILNQRNERLSSLTKKLVPDPLPPGH